MTRNHMGRKITGVIAGIAVAFIGMPAAAQAAACPTVPVAQKFKQFGDLAYYNLAAGGDFESKKWTYTGKTAIIAGNEPWKLNNTKDKSAISIPAGSTAISPPICVGVEHPHFRFVAALTSGNWGTMWVKMRYTDPVSKKVITLIVGSMDFSGGNRAWTVSPQMGLGNSLPIYGAATVNVQIILEPIQNSGTWSVDDVFIDPYRK